MSDSSAAASNGAGASASELGKSAVDMVSQPQYTSDGLLQIGMEDCPKGTPVVKGPDFESNGTDFEKLMEAYKTMGFQATNLAMASEEIHKMLSWRLSDDEIKPSEGDDWKDPARRATTRCTVWLSFTSNMISSGQREVIHFLVKNKMVSAIVTTAGAVEEDIMKTLRPHYVGESFEAYPGPSLRMKGINRIGNLLVPNLNYVALEEWFMPVLGRMHDEQDDKKKKPRRIWSPSQIIQRLGEEIKDESSVWYWCAKNKIPVFCPSLTDGAIGDMLFYHSYERETPFIVDIVQDVRRINNIARRAKRSGMVILGGGVVKHHVCNANLMRNGADHAIFINTAVEFDGSDSGARPDEAVSWGKIKLTAKPVKIHADATLVFPLLVGSSFVKVKQAAVKAAEEAAAKKEEIKPGSLAASFALGEGFAAPAERDDDPE